LAIQDSTLLYYYSFFVDFHFVVIDLQCFVFFLYNDLCNVHISIQGF